MKNCLGIYPKLEKVILTYAEMVRNRMQQQITEAKEAQKELQQMIISLKILQSRNWRVEKPLLRKPY